MARGPPGAGPKKINLTKRKENKNKLEKCNCQKAKSEDIPKKYSCFVPKKRLLVLYKPNEFKFQKVTK